SEAPTKYEKTSIVNNSIIANGCIIEGEVKNCIIGRKVHIAKGAKLEGCIIMQETKIGKNTNLKNVIADKKSIIPDGEEVIAPVSSPHVWERNNND
ncbi:MAG: glucose-1-phosphate adenylyltransferase subunit GlgD, partial [Clostridium sp.]|nr:glucose-1-phosphate adenylyltransferase subunit GlgD [Clostridium sp.]